MTRFDLGSYLALVIVWAVAVFDGPVHASDVGAAIAVCLVIDGITALAKR